MSPLDVCIHSAEYSIQAEDWLQLATKGGGSRVERVEGRADYDR